MSAKGNGLQNNKQPEVVMEFSSATDILYHWSNSFSCVLKSELYLGNQSAADIIQELVPQPELVFENLQRLILDGMIGNEGVQDKGQFIRLIQILLTQVLDNISLHSKENQIHETLYSYKTLTYGLLKTMHFIQEYFSNYFDRNENAPLSFVRLHKSEMDRYSTQLKKVISDSANQQSKLARFIQHYFLNDANEIEIAVSYQQLFYKKELIKELLKENQGFEEDKIRAILYYFNFNQPDFVMYEFERLTMLLNNKVAKAERINFLRNELKIINQLPTRSNYCFDSLMPTLKEQVSTWISEEVRYIETGQFAIATSLSISENENKIHTTLSVAKLAVLIRLLVVDKIIINRTVAPMLRVVAKIFTTLQREEISFGSLETKYHAPDKATIKAVKDMLFKWINILSRL